MKAKFFFLLLVCILVGCAKNADIESVNLLVEPASQTVLPKISKDISNLSADDAIKVANLFSHGSVLTKSENLKEVKSVVPIKDASERTLMYAVNYDDGYAVVSATKKYHPVLATVDHGTYTGEKTGTGQDVLMNEYMVATEAAIDGEITIEGNPWSVYEEVPFEMPVRTKVSDEYYDVVNQYTSEWYNAGYNIYYLNQQPENMPDDMYAEFCDYASYHDRPDHDYMQCSFIVENPNGVRYQKGPYVTTSWGQEGAYNDGLDNNLPLGCTTIAIAQIMKSIGHPSIIQWTAMPNVLRSYESNIILTGFLANLRADIGVDSLGNATVLDVENAVKTFYGYNNSNGYATSIINHEPASASVRLSLDQELSVFMGGVHPTTGSGHAWVCDGYYSLTPQTEYYLYVIPINGVIDCLELVHSNVVYPVNAQLYRFYHMNWGWDGQHNGFYIEGAVAPNGNSYGTRRVEMIISKTTGI